MPLTLPPLSTTGKLVKPDLYSLSRVSGPRISLWLTKIILSFLTMRSLTFLSSKLMMAAMRARSASLKIDLGVRRRTSINSSRVLGVYFGGLAGVFALRNLSSLGSSHLTNLRIKSSNMI